MRNYDYISKIKEESGRREWTFTVLRPDSENRLEKMNVSVTENDPRAATRSFSPKTFESPD